MSKGRRGCRIRIKNKVQNGREMRDGPRGKKKKIGYILIQKERAVTGIKTPSDQLYMCRPLSGKNNRTFRVVVPSVGTVLRRRKYRFVGVQGVLKLFLYIST